MISLKYGLLGILGFFSIISVTSPQAMGRRCPRGSKWNKKTISCVKIVKKGHRKSNRPKKKKISVDMVKVNPGTFFMGRNNKKTRYIKNAPKHKVTITKAFYIAKYEVTRKLWIGVMGTKPFKKTKCSDECPAENVTWIQAVTFCNKLSKKNGLSLCYKNIDVDPKWNKKCKGYRLLTEAEWEYAARAGEKNDTPASWDAYVWHAGNSGTLSPLKYLREAGTRMPNKWGIYDMLGSVFEWVWDRYGNYPSAPVSDPLGSSTGINRVFRGGSFISVYFTMGYPHRSNAIPAHRYKTIGFRIARSIFSSSKKKTARK